MSITPQTVFASISDEMKRELLARHGVNPDHKILSGDFANIRAHASFERDLNYIATLGTDYAAPILREFLSDAGWTQEHFEKSKSLRNRACALLCRHPEEFKIAFAVWNGNRLRGFLDREDGFKLPELESYSFASLTEPEERQLQTRLNEVMSEFYSGRSVSEVNLFRRTSKGLPTMSGHVLQCDISFGEDPENIEVLDDGQATVISISRLARISVIIDVDNGTLFVGTHLGKRKMRQAVAEAVVEAVFQSIQPMSQLAAIRVYPERCNRPIEFSYSVADGIEKPHISELRFRLFGASSDFVYSVRTDDPQRSGIYTNEQVQKLDKRMRVFRAVVDFTFNPIGDAPPIRRRVTLTEPSGISFGRAFPEERLTIERVLSESGLVDQDFQWTGLTKLRGISRLETPQHLMELRQSWVPGTLDALITAGVVKKGEPHERAWCSESGQSHPIRVELAEDEPKYTVLSSLGIYPLRQEQIDTMVLSIDGVVKWLWENATQKTLEPSEISNRSWFLGNATTVKGSKPFDLIFTTDVDEPQVTSELNEFLLRRHIGQRGLIMTLNSEPVQRVFPQDWRVTPFHAVCDIKGGKLKFIPSRAAAALRGQKAKKPHKSEEDWNEIFALFEANFPLDEQMQPYTIANQLMYLATELCDMTARSLVDRLRERYPETFPESTHMK